MHRTLTAACLAAAAALTLAACDPATDDGKAVRPAVTTTSATPSAAPSTTAPTGTLPSLIGRTLPTARKTARAADFMTVTAHDATGASRAQTIEADWRVCFQQPGAGTAELATPVALAVVLRAETCPAADGIPAPTPKPTPTPAPTTTKPKPKATTAHTGNGNSGGSSGGGSTSGGGSGGSGGGSGHTEPPVDDHGGATALCNDGTLSFAAHHQGACSHHHGVKVFYK
ncbi:DUF3761 domain-containing protein [Streptomyces sp. NPDC006733]|uniref:DUF3761 domain-containing protein n=1 Tax=Streptomyces sp. NPDC006733 TaxID=3155460 RepID=UPI0034077106